MEDLIFWATLYISMTVFFAAEGKAKKPRLWSGIAALIALLMMVYHYAIIKGHLTDLWS